DHMRRVEGFVERAREAGDRVVRGGERWKDDGLWYLPTLVEPKDNYSEIVQREVFGPVLTYQTFSDEAEAVELANSTRYGLSAIRPRRWVRQYERRRSWSTRSWFWNSRQRSAGWASPGSGGRAAPVPSTSTPT